MREFNEKMGRKHDQGKKMPIREKNNLRKRKKYRKAVWQFIKDHSHPQQDGSIRVIFNIENESDFWARINAREVGYQREEGWKTY